MSTVLKFLQAFPRGLSIERLYALNGGCFSENERMAVLAELSDLARSGLARRRVDGLWFAAVSSGGLNARVVGAAVSTGLDGLERNVLTAAPFKISFSPVDVEVERSEAKPLALDPQALLRYWRSALRSDPRGAMSEAVDRHGAVWHLIAGHGPLVPEADLRATMVIELDALSPDFREALLKRAANENALAIGWPLAVGRRSGVPVIWPVGLISATWTRQDGQLHIDIALDDILINPDWIKGAARQAGWKAAQLEEIFGAEEGVGLQSKDFLERLREAMARQTRSKVSGQNLASELDPTHEGIFDCAALFLPDDSTFTAGAVRDLDEIAQWPPERLVQSALAPALGLEPSYQPAKPIAAVNVGSLNAEQIAAVRAASEAALTVVTGPPGTGKSQAIVSMAASVILAGGSVLVASKNHQALDAVEDRLGGLVPDADFLVRTLDPEREIDRSFRSVLGDLTNVKTRAAAPVDIVLLKSLEHMAINRAAMLDAMLERDRIESELAELHERLETRRKFSAQAPVAIEEDLAPMSLWARVLAAISLLLRGRAPEMGEAQSKVVSLSSLEARLSELHSARKALRASDSVVQLSDQIAELAQRVLSMVVKERVSLSNECLSVLEDAKADLDFQGRQTAVPFPVAQTILGPRPLWLASILGTPKRIPLETGLFDLVIFDEASQCDIASALPLMARAKRMVVVGDDRQLSFIPQLGQAKDRNLMQAQNLPVEQMSRYAQSRNSLFDFAKRLPAAHKILLRQQYRSVGPIVDYISSEFYGSALKVAYDPERIVTPKAQKAGIAWTHVAAPMVSEGNNVNRAEVRAIVEQIQKLLLSENYTGTIGVTSPFRGLCCANPVRDSSRESNMVAGVHEQTHLPDLQD
ncbi:DEAD/DEAH box helicase [Pseudogemmobacter faecipullorum]|uniref:AAA family ATPase n=1 Tax=Pseudogemmobacter faecipullorum TaxID=2755041 RepID=A0ABS8CSP3_9RHOB|nr:AAA domain-containing protein [Pseudogemmobacter faecipullorum]MCB5412420.1 AAA family ATPase [Pseudogemmobacter faecipullorum]